MRPAFALAAAVLAVSTLGAGLVAAQPRSAPAAQDWTRNVVLTPEGGFRMGNPNAKVKLVEYGSLTCPHCADFAASAKGPLAAYVRSGKVSFEYRSYVLNGIDLTATLVARCAAPARFFPLVDELFASQGSWVGRISGLPQAQKDRLKGLPESQRLGRLADIGGITAIAARHGIPAAQSKRCLADNAALERLGRMGEAAEALGVQGTPTFFVNGSNIGSHDWSSLQPILREAAG
ncbi:MAG TPA: thioredoxin domain-containing protein [Allosphingosinicella sp.]|jgi:protein-disulfide isomerase